MKSEPHHIDESSNKHKVPDEQTKSDGAVVATGKKEKEKRKEKKLDDSYNDAKDTQSEKKIIDDLAPDLNVKSNQGKKRNKIPSYPDRAEQVHADTQNEPADKPAKKRKDKKKKTNLDAKSLNNVEHHKSLELTNEQKLKDIVSSEKRVANSEVEDKFRAKKKKKDKLSKGLSEGDQEELKKEKASQTESKKDDKRTSEEDAYNKVSKKRKRLDSENNDARPDNNKEGEELKRRKKDFSDEPDRTGQSVKLKASAETEKQGVNEIQETPIGQPDGQANGNLVKNEAESALEKSGKGKQSGRKEPPKPFQRVNIEDVIFVDERLQDNSYWAKGGAESGYGAKAQEVLGQVRGRGFRHEKTKKKRGTYRGGQIDMQSHSIKFDVSDDE
ncbi:nucleolar and coiled-body phosphoprotein 1-like [Carica papaya]|uniref:nucleolar and coiled-body phosphoprotein 1-like n=1 Tax=Carica papaya TaxID=3649 RepID=UPI000B8CCE61|nr:nucleolar and coiled-body phosphoprotein 1-like [Carica papaya]